MGEPIEVQQLTKHFGKHKLFKQVTFTFKPQTTYLITGPNGSGKSTLFNIVMGLMGGISGTVHTHRLTFAYAPSQLEQRPQTVAQFLRALIAVDVSPQQARQKCQTLLTIFGLQSYRKTKMMDLSTGTRQKVNLVQAFVQTADILMLDEPLSGLDKTAREQLIQHLQQRDDYQNILIASHEIQPLLVIKPTILQVAGGKLVPQTATKTRTDRDHQAYQIQVTEATPMRQLPETVTAEMIIERTARTLVLRVPAVQSDKLVLELIQTGFHLEVVHAI
ncbi:ABC transporter ATP-binding protein [Agrilactobacillus fermenti]|uniref:ABC transporter ATP-binding protein n=1 Tax=Agrilactobacillus fermenti TaxID=2586909 RepID=UPI003A5BFFF8